MAEHDADREPDEKDAAPGGEQGPSFDETAAWEAIVAGYGDEPPDPPGAKPFKSVEDLALLEPETNDAGGAGDSGGKNAATPKGAKSKQGGTDTTGPEADSETDARTDAKASPKDEPGAGKPLGSSVAFAPGVAGPRDFSVSEPAEEDFDEDDEGHFVPPEPPPLPAADATAKFAWLGVIGGPVLLLLAVLLGWEMTWYLATLGIGGFLGGFATLVGRMRGDEEDEDDPGRGAVV
ncbi:hypothetical protein C6Y14_16435 [Streptomyces dioscori]|uniref:DUF308 domain-containing protein n=1 Tax=Streptomyces dioscori TaxID=2109333 RepID=A0A2P8Q721_9ACTN|nr:hypothetical protein [Streptomyces dioscori]PSM42022.1 hypothetical protein C6Y14_16435 [Streptomyces dioscori]